MSDMQAWLDQGKTLADQATEGPWEAYEDSDQHLAGCPPTIENLVYAGAVETPIIDWGNGSTKRDTEFIADARTRLPQALDALQAVLDLHKPYTLEEPAWTYCLGCLSPDDLSLDGDAYPCPTVRAIQDAIGEPQ